MVREHTLRQYIPPLGVDPHNPLHVSKALALSMDPSELRSSET